MITGRYYVGMHATPDPNDNYIGSGKILRASIKKYGRQNHVKQILEYAESEEHMRAREALLVNQELLSDPLCMNIRCGGKGRPGKTAVSLETRTKISNSLKGTKRGPLSELTKQKISQKLTGIKRTDEQKQHLSALHTGKSLSEEHKMNIAKARTGVKRSEETRRRMSESRKEN